MKYVNTEKFKNVKGFVLKKVIPYGVALSILVTSAPVVMAEEVNENIDNQVLQQQLVDQNGNEEAIDNNMEQVESTEFDREAMINCLQTTSNFIKSIFRTKKLMDEDSSIDSRKTFEESYDYYVELQKEKERQYQEELKRQEELKVVNQKFEQLSYQNRLDFYYNTVLTGNCWAPYTLGNATSVDTYQKFMQKGEWNYLVECCSNYGIDPYLMAALYFQESSLNHASVIPGGRSFNGSAYGYGQVIPFKGRTATAYNYNTKTLDTINVTKSSLIDPYGNIQASVMIFANNMATYNYNIFLSLAAYNAGGGSVNKALKNYSAKTGKSVEQIKNDYSDLGWMAYTGSKYINKVFSRYIGSSTTFRDGTYEYLIDLRTLQVDKREIEAQKQLTK